MVNVIQVGDRSLNKASVCLSTDTKPTSGVGNGDLMIEMDTGKVYFFNQDAGEWIEFA